MGINGLLPALKPISRPVHVSKYQGQRVAVDGYSWLHKGAHGCAKELCEGIWTDRYVVYFMSRIHMLRSHGVEPYIVFDGGRLPIKGDEEATRRRARTDARQRAAAHMAAGNVAAAVECYQRCVDITPAMAKCVIEELKAAAVTFLVAPYEADAQMAYLARTGEVQLVITEDSDLLAYGCPRVLYKLDRSGAGEEVALSDLPNCPSLPLASWTSDQFLQLCIMAGCDYLAQLPGIGIKKAHGALRQYRTFTKAVKMLRFNGTKVPPDYEAKFQLALWAFRHARVYCPAQKALVHLSPLPGGGIGASDVDVPAAFLQLEQQGQHQQLDFLGPPLGSEVVRGIAEGELDPSTHQPFDLAALYAGCNRPPAHLASRLGATQRHPAADDSDGDDAADRDLDSRPGVAAAGRPRVGLSRRHTGHSSGGRRHSAGAAARAGGSGGDRGAAAAASGGGRRRSTLGIAKFFLPAKAAGAGADAGTGAGGVGSRSAAPAAPLPGAGGIQHSIFQAVATLGQALQQRHQQEQADKRQLLTQLAQQQGGEHDSIGLLTEDEGEGAAAGAGLPPAKRRRTVDGTAAGSGLAPFGSLPGSNAGEAGDVELPSLDQSLPGSLGLPSKQHLQQQERVEGAAAAGGGIGWPPCDGDGGSSGALQHQGQQQQGLEGSGGWCSTGEQDDLCAGLQPSLPTSGSSSQPLSSGGGWQRAQPVSALTALFGRRSVSSAGDARKVSSFFGSQPLVAAAGGDDSQAPSQVGDDLCQPPPGARAWLSESPALLGSSGLSIGACSSSSLGLGGLGATAAASSDVDPAVFGGPDDGSLELGDASNSAPGRLRMALRRQQQQQALPGSWLDAAAGAADAIFGSAASGSDMFGQQQQEQDLFGVPNSRRRHSRFREQVLATGSVQDGHFAAAIAAAQGADGSPDGLALDQATDSGLGSLQDLQPAPGNAGVSASPCREQPQGTASREASVEPSSTTGDSNEENTAAVAAGEDNHLGITHVREYAKLAHRVVRHAAKQQQQQPHGDQQQQQQQQVPLTVRPGLSNLPALPQQQQHLQHASTQGISARAPVAAGAAAEAGKLRTRLGLGKHSKHGGRSSQAAAAGGGAKGAVGAFAAKLAGLRYDPSLFVMLDGSSAAAGDASAGQAGEQGWKQGPDLPLHAAPAAAAGAARRPFKAPWLPSCGGGGGRGASPVPLCDADEDPLAAAAAAAPGSDAVDAGFGAFGGFACAVGAAAAAAAADGGGDGGGGSSRRTHVLNGARIASWR